MSDAESGSEQADASARFLSSTDVLERLPSGVLRLLVIFAPCIHTLHGLVRLATWTGGSGSYPKSVLLLISWWTLCLYGYPITRYAPQSIALALIGYTGLRRFINGPVERRKGLTSELPATTTADINVTISELDELADFASSLRNQLIRPIIELISWDPSPQRTRALAILLVTTWPIYLACFLPWSAFPRSDVLISTSPILTALSEAARAVWHFVIIGREKALIAMQQHMPAAVPHLMSAATQGRRAQTLYLAHIHPKLHAIASALHFRVIPSSITLSAFPPYPLGSLDVSSALLILGTVALTWCAPWAALLRHAMWQSAAVRRGSRAFVRIASASAWPGKAFGRGYDGHIKLQADATLNTQSVDKSRTKVKASHALTHHEDVVYQFSIYENQRWWVGLDWTAALLPQERPSWADESNNPVSPPSSFALPPAKISLKPTPDASNPRSHTRRVVKWQWLDSEWTVAGARHVPGQKESDLERKPDGYLNDAFERIRNARSANISDPPKALASGEQDGGEVSTTEAPLASRRDAFGDLSSEVLDVDDDGWQYGDNSFGKLSSKSGIGRYTRRRRWQRKACLVEIVEVGYTPTDEELRD